MTFEDEHKNVFCNNEYGVLKKVILCEPKYMAIREIINETQKYYNEQEINHQLAVKQHSQFIDALRQCGVEVLLIPAQKTYPEQVFTRDIGFTIGDQVCVSRMARRVRQGEEIELKNRLSHHQMPYLDIREGMIEGGDVMIAGTTVYVGVSSRTNMQAIDYLEEALPEYHIVPIPFQDKYLHLDCVFNILSEGEALFFPQAFEEDTIVMLNEKFKLIEVSEKEQFTLGTNVLSIGNKQVFSLPVNQKVNQRLRNEGYSVMEIDLSEIIKSGGSFRCCTLPILRR
ncbi:N-dimethylarginine dimethylaminohydrolase [Lederbergia galactosidilyticus]|uniref:dimethylarginine dimethylaminohydrolase family protein n=1 Tax=Lederbergia galactosidilytica TaxID=217031 RepID=UPI001D7777D9|nr:dimethylarginine dimethylaminohydrolase family protein [Lederbergia galactosidilytica]MBP1913493.1 N-dimethylarginine dimethylaminohydrolase [Lederbergia galactosidilytica]